MAGRVWPRLSGVVGQAGKSLLLTNAKFNLFNNYDCLLFFEHRVGTSPLY